MARSDLLLNIVRAATQGDQLLLRRTVEAIAAEERAKNHHVLADRLRDLLISGNGTKQLTSSPDRRTQPLIFETVARRTLDDLQLSSTVRATCDQLVEEQFRADLLRSYGLEPRHRVLLAGPPGNGKTTLSEALAQALMVPFLVVRYEGIISSFLGETAARLSELFDHIRDRRCVLFFDEFDTLGKERGDIHETGEIKRVVSSLLLQIDALPSHVIVIAATNHSELLDRATWRRFEVKLHLTTPERSDIDRWFARFEERTGLRLGVPRSTLAAAMTGASYAELEQFATDIQRRYILDLPNANVRKIVKNQLAAWGARYQQPSQVSP